MCLCQCSCSVPLPWSQNGSSGGSLFPPCVLCSRLPLARCVGAAGDVRARGHEHDCFYEWMNERTDGWMDKKCLCCPSIKGGKCLHPPFPRLSFPCFVLSSPILGLAPLLLTLSSYSSSSSSSSPLPSFPSTTTSSPLLVLKLVPLPPCMHFIELLLPLLPLQPSCPFISAVCLSNFHPPH